MTGGLAERFALARLDLVRQIGDASVAIVAVTKTRSPLVVTAAIDAGFDQLGENYAQEFAAKVPDVGVDRATWHYIGQLQTNKVRLLAPIASAAAAAGRPMVIQSVDRQRLASEIAHRIPGAMVFVQVDLSGGVGRGGVTFDAAPALLDEVRGLGLDLRGVMGVAPQSDAATIATAFGRLRRLRDDEGLEHCSMGMSADFAIAVAEGSTMVRIGSAIFGPRS